MSTEQEIVQYIADAVDKHLNVLIVSDSYNPDLFLFLTNNSHNRTYNRADNTMTYENGTVIRWLWVEDEQSYLKVLACEFGGIVYMNQYSTPLEQALRTKLRLNREQRQAGVEVKQPIWYTQS